LVLTVLQLLGSFDTWLALATLSILEVVLGIDNVIFLSLVANRVAKDERRLARRIGLALALALRIVFLSGIAFIIHLSTPLFTISGIAVSFRDVIFGSGGLFLLTKGTREIHGMVEGEEDTRRRAHISLFVAVVQIALFDIVFSIDSVVTAVGMVESLPVMIAAVVLAMLVMLVASGLVADFIERNPTVKMLALSFLLVIGMALVADAAHFHIPRAYLYFAVAFSGGVEALNQYAARGRARREASDETAKSSSLRR
jgi:predicted tellurium resistance membrane protein TerC